VPLVNKVRSLQIAFAGDTLEGVTEDAAGGRRQGETSPANSIIYLLYFPGPSTYKFLPFESIATITGKFSTSNL
jgi:hypothetical protein